MWGVGQKPHIHLTWHHPFRSMDVRFMWGFWPTPHTPPALCLCAFQRGHVRLWGFFWFISVLHQTTTSAPVSTLHAWLSYISVLHQTTTWSGSLYIRQGCLISLFYIKPQPISGWGLFSHRCLISLFYIKPQPSPDKTSYPIVVLYLCSTSNHNLSVLSLTLIVLSYISVLHQTTTSCAQSLTLLRCLISLFYIKPQPNLSNRFAIAVVLYLCSTSNHNYVLRKESIDRLSYISVLHQTTTPWPPARICPKLSYISVLHQTTTCMRFCILHICCLISLFYIKPQPREGSC